MMVWSPSTTMIQGECDASCRARPQHRLLGGHMRRPAGPAAGRVAGRRPAAALALLLQRHRAVHHCQPAAGRTEVRTTTCRQCSCSCAQGQAPNDPCVGKFWCQMPAARVSECGCHPEAVLGCERSRLVAQPLRIMCCRSWTDQYLVYMYGTWVIWLLELIWCQLFLALGAPDGQLRRKSGIVRGAAQKLCCGWRLTRRGSSAPAAGSAAILPVTVALAAQPAAAAADTAGKDAKQSEGDKQTAAAEQAPQQLAGELAKMNLSDALSGQEHCCCCCRSFASLHIHGNVIQHIEQLPAAADAPAPYAMQSRGWQTIGCWGSCTRERRCSPRGRRCRGTSACRGARAPPTGGHSTHCVSHWPPVKTHPPVESHTLSGTFCQQARTS